MDKNNTIEQWIDKLSQLTPHGGNINFSLLGEGVEETIKTQFEEIDTYLKENVDSAHGNEDEHFERFLTVSDKITQLRNDIKNTRCNLGLTVLEIRTIEKLLRQKVKYNNVSVFYGIHLKRNLLDTLPSVSKNANQFDVHEIEITFSNSMALYHVFETVELTGLANETYAFGNILYNLSEVSKIYKHYDELTNSLDNVIGLWNKGINPFKDPSQQEPTLEISE